VTVNVELRAINTIKPYDQNPRRNDAAVDAVARSIAEFGFKQPLVVDSEGVVIVGHTRLKAALKLGWKEVPVHVAHGLTPEQARAYRIADNQTATIATWDDDLLADELAGLKAMNYDLANLGFSDAELSALLNPPTTGGLSEADDVPEPLPDVDTKRGDLWLLGPHRLYCGDSTDAADVDRLMDGHKAALCATDPPYLVDYTGERVGDSGKDWSGSYREVDIKDAGAFFLGLFTNVLRVIAPHAALYCWHAHKRQAEIAAIWKRLSILDHQQVIWVKPTSVFGSVFYHFRHEPCMLGWRQGSKPHHDGSHEFNSVWEIDWEGRARVVGNEHPTQKPVEIFARPIRKHTQRGDIVYEPFSGSGSQLIAAEQTGRRCYAMELEPRFVEVAVRRWEKFSGKTAQRISANAADSQTPPANAEGGKEAA
jgi:DNA modification methylase